MAENNEIATQRAIQQSAVAIQHHGFLTRYGGRALLGLALSIIVLLWMAGEPAILLLRYERAKVLQGEVWRLFTAHWVHEGLRHMALNVAGALLIAALCARIYNVLEWLIILFASMLSIDVGFLWLEPQLIWYLGASGVLHGALAAGAIAWWRTETRWMAAALSAILIGKLTWEQVHGALPLAGQMPVVVNAHLYGALGGAATALVIELLRRRQHSKTKI